ncbi:hypothetical protein BN946_scf184668.g6 [Trametes cinnabarina]|uniref:Uncharacterized protein n=1 Tax=Pycnoporus cinnabarinus TaxID=5643 RepID=A0A060STL3_PYCCI|nr:hypothetical protein BN946_scf184668.g6 [Trametes cinnabarina]
MHIRVIPAYPQSEIVFTFSMPDPMHDDTKPCPGAWRTQIETLEALQEEGLSLDFPRDIHALDKSTWHSALVNEITFDAARRTITCLFVDGFTVSWPMASTGRESRCLAALDDVSAAVRRYTRGEQPSRKYWVADQPLSPVSEAYHPPQSETSSISTGSQRSKHRRQRSLLGSIVSAFKGMLPDNLGLNSGPILPSSLPPLRIPPTPGHTRSSSTFSRTQLSPPTSPTVAESQAPQPFTLVIRPRQIIPLPEGYVPPDPNQALRRFARSLMLDVVREHVYPMFSTTGPPSFTPGPQTLEWAAQVAGFPPGLYPAWAARSMLRQTEERLREMVAEANARGLGHVLAEGTIGHSLPSRHSLRESDDSDETNSAGTSASATSLSTETDGSSVHTPVDSPACSPFAPAAPSFPHLPGLELKVLPQVPRSPSPPAYEFDFSTYHALSTLRSRLFAILSSFSSTPRQIHNLQQGMRYGSALTVLEIKSRRRAWSCRDFVGRASLSLVGLSTPVRSSPLARCEPITAESLARMQSGAVHQERSRLSCLPDEGAEFGIPSPCGGVRVMTKELDSRLFSLSEEDEEEEDEDDSRPGYQSGYGLDEYVDHERWRDDLDDDLESGLLAFPRPEPVGAPAASPYSFPHSNSHPMVRPRTTSMLKERPCISPSPTAPLPLSHAGGGLPPNSILCQPFEAKVPVVLDDGDSLVSGPMHGSEFTLAMDLPSPFSPSSPPRGWVGDSMAGIRTRR